MTELHVQMVSPNTENVCAILQRHFELMRATSPAESCHAMEPENLEDADIVLMGARCDGQLLAIGALKALTADHGELKSMHTLEAA